MTRGFIIVKRDDMFRDIGVFTGAGELVHTERMLGADTPLIQMQADVSTEIERAFVFPQPWQAYRWVDALSVPWGDERATRILRLTQWVVRNSGDFTPGVPNHNRADTTGSDHRLHIVEIERQAYMAGFHAGERHCKEMDALALNAYGISPPAPMASPPGDQPNSTCLSG